MSTNQQIANEKKIEATFERCPHDAENPYVMISRALIGDPTISLASRALLAFLLTLPKGWKIYHSHLMKTLNVGEHQLNSCLEELIEAGYVDRTRERINGTFQPYKYFIREFKKCLPNRVSQPGFPGPGNQALQKKEEDIYPSKQQQNMGSDAQGRDSAAVQTKKQNQAKPLIHECFKKLDIPEDRKTALSKICTPKEAEDALAWANAQPNFRKGFLATLTYAVNKKIKNEKSVTPFARVNKLFKNQEKYEGATCYLDEKGIAFERGMKHAQVKFDMYFKWDKLLDLCSNFGINLPMERLT
jgi:hypothetical protein